MSATSRRKFLSGAAAAGAGMAYAVAAESAEVRATPSHDEMVAIDFIDWPRHQERPEGPTRLACLFYGLVCVDVPNKEALLPNTSTVPNVRLHRARFWTTTASIVGTNPFTGAETGTDATGVLTWVSLATYKVDFAPSTGSGLAVADPLPSGNVKWRNSSQHPWGHEKWVRSLKAQTGKSLIDDDEREDTARVISRVQLRGGRVMATPPYTRQGQHAEWKSTLPDGRVVTRATTDSMLWTRTYPRSTEQVRVTLGNSTGVKTLYLRISPTGLPVAITHATDATSADPTKMTDSTAFARLLEGNDPGSFPVPELATLPDPAPLRSSEDVHCEGGKP